MTAGEEPGMVGTAGQSSIPMPGGHVVYVQGAPEVPVRYLGAVPGVEGAPGT